MITNYFIWFMFYSFLGWLYESVLYTLMTGRAVNTGFLYGPFCPIYGLGAVFGVMLFYERFTSAVEIFILAFLIEGTFEFIVGTVLENVFHRKWWDYSELKFNIKGRVCLLSSTAFGLLVVALIKFIHPFVSAVTGVFPHRFLKMLAVILFIVLIHDLVFTIASMGDKGNSAIYCVFCEKLRSYDKKFSNFVYRLLSTSSILSSIMAESRKITDKITMENMSRDYVPLNKESFTELKDRVEDKFKK